MVRRKKESKSEETANWKKQRYKFWILNFKMIRSSSKQSYDFRISKWSGPAASRATNVEILARTGNNVKPIRENETGKHSSLAGVWNMYRTRTNHSPRNFLREDKRFQPLVKKRPLYNNHIQNTNVQYTGMHKRGMHKITVSSEYSKIHTNHIPVILRTHRKGIFPRKLHRYGNYHLQRT